VVALTLLRDNLRRPGEPGLSQVKK